ncbi:bleomycin resistance family protein [Flaviaesturariibacter flavus]|uniref:Bleomycin resistance family protein n=1 Tax=Flaviaesturariibacter flavus TaxID=2502780 RepID=A0A4R1BNA4_9BACT|nr:VOC family protein [Flaviaesturariibacter flavus]TCJ18979.1 bleomycin resistance family protein [Flaviaesturariibacter flavus]
MKLLELRPLLWVPDLRAAVDWYVEILCFTEDEYSEEWQWASLHRDGVGLMMAHPTGHIPYEGPKFTGSLYLRTDDVEGWWQRLKDRAEVVYPVESFDWNMREFAIRDLNGFMIQIGQELEP